MSIGIHNPGGSGGGGAGTLSVKTLDATGQSAGNLNLTDAAWDVSKAKIDYISITVASGSPTDFDIAFYEDDTFSSTTRYEAQALDHTVDSPWEDDIEWILLDNDGTNEIHLQITENTGSGTYDIHVRGIELT